MTQAGETNKSFNNVYDDLISLVYTEIIFWYSNKPLGGISNGMEWICNIK
jgi:hypothetical protein